MLKIFKNLFDSNEKQIQQYRKRVEEINAFEKQMKKMSYEDIRQRTSELKEELKPLVEKIPDEDKESIRSLFDNGKKIVKKEEQAIKDKLQEMLPEAYAMVREVARRKMDRRHFDVQLIGGIVFAEGKIAELKTGEGKTQCAHLPLFLYGLTGRGSHLVTVNDYLSKRDGEYAGYILSELGLSVGIVSSLGSFKFISDDEIEKYKGKEAYEERVKLKIQNPGDVKGLNLIEVTKQEAYKCDVVYGTNNEFGFDYLRDNMVDEPRKMVQSELFFCIVDEVDSILIDEARTPLIISAAAEESNELYVQFARIVKQLDPKSDYEVSEKEHSAVLTEEGITKVERILGVKNLWEDYQLAHHLENALKAQTLYQKDDEYLIKEGQIMIIDSFTGRALPGRRYSEGLHQAIEAKEGVEIQKESKTLATITFQNFFRLYKHLAGMTGTAETEAEEFFKIYALETVVVPTVRPVIRIDQTDRVYKNQAAKFKAVVVEIKERHKKGQPILVGTTSVEKSEILSEMLVREGIKHQVLNAKHHEKEAHIVSGAGVKNAVTIATNMAGRGTDIKLGEGVADIGGLYVIGTERHEARRIDNQLRGRSGRLGDPGESRFFVALDDEIMRIQGGEIVQKIMTQTKMDDSIPIEVGLIGKSIEGAQKRVEGMNFDIRKRVVEYDDVMNQQRMIYYQRRRRIIEDANTAKEDKNSSANETLSQMIVDSLENEAKKISTKYFLAEEQDLDGKNLLNDFLDFADDRLLEESYQKAFDTTDDLQSALMEKDTKEEAEELMSQTLKQAFDIKRKLVGDSELSELIKHVYLETMDQSWTDHLEAMQDLREGIGLRGYAQRDPLVEYKNEGFNMFDQFVKGIDSKVAKRILKVQKVDDNQLRRLQGKQLTNVDEIEDIMTGSRDAYSLLQKAIKNTQTKIETSMENDEKKVSKPYTTVKNIKKVGRNDPCPCGSGKKYKKCHGKTV